MKYKIVKGSKLFDQLKGLQKRCDVATDQALKLVKSLDATHYAPRDNGISGGISGIRFDEKPEGWKYAWPDDDRSLFFPKQTKANKELLARIDALPMVQFQDLNGIVGFEIQSVERTFMRCPGINWGNEVVLIEISEKAHYSPVYGMEEITTSEFKELSARIAHINESSKTPAT